MIKAKHIPIIAIVGIMTKSAYSLAVQFPTDAVIEDFTLGSRAITNVMTTNSPTRVTAMLFAFIPFFCFRNLIVCYASIMIIQRI